MSELRAPVEPSSSRGTSGQPAQDPAVATLVSSRVERLEALRARVPIATGRALDTLRELSARLVRETGGRLVEAPLEGWLAAFPTTPAAVQYGLRLQEELLSVEWPTTLVLRPEAAEHRDDHGALLFRGPRVSQGVHVGRLELHHDRAGREVAGGPAVYQVARIAQAAHGGQLVLGEQAWRTMRGALGGATVLRDLGPHELYGVGGIGRLYQVLPVALDRREFPPPRTTGVVRGNVRDVARSFVGRDGDLAALAELDEFGVRLVSLVGPPGVGKTALARRYALAHGARYRGAGGIWLAELAGRSVHHLVRAAGLAVGVPLVLGRRRADMVEQIGHALAARGPVLLVIDIPGAASGEAEPDLDPLSPVVAQWLRMAPQARVLLTAPRRLGLKGEVAYELGPLSHVAAEGAHVADAIRLYTSRAQEVDPTYQSPDPEPVTDLVARLERNPLALELAAGLVDRIDLDAVARSLEELPGGPLRVLELVWSSLEPLERATVEAAAVYPGGFDPLGVEAVVDEPDEGAPEVAVVLAGLVARGLVCPSTEGAAPGVRRYVVPARIRAHALGQVAPERLETLHRRCADRLLALCEPWPERSWGREGPEVTARLVVESTNLLGVIEWGLSEDRDDASAVDRALRALLLLQPVFASRGPAVLFVNLLDRALERVDKVLGADPLLQVRVLVARADVRRQAGRPRQAQADLERGRAIAERWADVEGQAMCASSLGLALRELGRADEAAVELERAVAGFAEVGARRLEGVAQGSLGVLQMEMGRSDEADASLHRAVATFRELSARHFEGMYLGNLGLFYRRLGRAEQARALYREAQQIHRETGDQRLEGVSLLNLGVLDYHLGRLDDAERSFREALRLSREVGDRRTEAACMGNLALLAMERGDADEARESLLQGMAINRDLDDRRGEAMDLGYLGILQHLSDQSESARSTYGQTLRLLEQVGGGRAEVLFIAWLGALEAEDGEIDAGAARLHTARDRAEGASDRSLFLVIEALSLILARARGEALDPGPLETLREAARADGDLRIAMRRVDAVLSREP